MQVIGIFTAVEEKNKEKPSRFDSESIPTIKSNHTGLISLPLNTSSVPVNCLNSDNKLVTSSEEQYDRPFKLPFTALSSNQRRELESLGKNYINDKLDDLVTNIIPVKEVPGMEKYLREKSSVSVGSGVTKKKSSSKSKRRKSEANINRAPSNLSFISKE